MRLSLYANRQAISAVYRPKFLIGVVEVTTAPLGTKRGFDNTDTLNILQIYLAFLFLPTADFAIASNLFLPLQFRRFVLEDQFTQRCYLVMFLLFVFLFDADNSIPKSFW